jgi:hypothetical protein
MPDNAESEALASYWLQHTEAWQSSGKTQQAYCETNELSYHRFGFWRRKFLQQSHTQTPPAPRSRRPNVCRRLCTPFRIPSSVARVTACRRTAFQFV